MSFTTDLNNWWGTRLEAQKPEVQGNEDRECLFTMHTFLSKSQVGTVGNSGDILKVTNGSVAEWSNAAVLKTVVLQGTGGSNPSTSAKSI